jgi:hypothetical protein
MFNRALGLVRPRDVDSELFEITYVRLVLTCTAALGFGILYSEIGSENLDASSCRRYEVADC